MNLRSSFTASTWTPLKCSKRPVVSFASTRAVSSLLYGVSTFDPITFAGIPLVLVGVTVLASYIPARRATRVDPVEALRDE